VETPAKGLWRCTSILDKMVHTGNYVAYINLGTTSEVERIAAAKTETG